MGGGKSKKGVFGMIFQQDSGGGEKLDNGGG